jgi:UDPglucose--hexose-1-phosphate uridylyltransferase
VTQPDLRHDPQSGRWTAIAPARQGRPGAEHTDDATCPFCAGNEHLTPPETLRLGDGPTGWAVRVVPNLYPALERQEVVVHGPTHVDSIADVPDPTLDLVAEAWKRRAQDVGGNCFAFLNEGDAGGASQRHSHSQLAWLPEARDGGTLPPYVPVLEQDGLLLACQAAARGAYDSFIAPLSPERSGLGSELLAPAIRLLAASIRRLRRLIEPDLPLNAWLLDGDPWRLELLPRLSRLAGLELGANVYVTPIAPEDAARALAGLERAVEQQP